MEEHEAPAGVSPVQVVDAVPRHAQQGVVGSTRWCLRIQEICEESEPEIRFLVAEKTHLQFLDLAPHHVFAREQHRNHNQRGVLRRYTFLEIHSGQLVRRQQRDHQRINHLNSQLAQRKGRQCAQHNAFRRQPHAGLPGQCNRDREKAQRQGCDTTEVECGRVPPHRAQKSPAHRRPGMDFSFQRSDSIG